MQRRSQAPSAPYGRACATCFKAKVRCLPLAGSKDCERCHRLKKPCLPSDSVRKRNAEKNRVSSERVTQLEDKIDGLVSLLHSAAKSPDSSAVLRQAIDNGGLFDAGQQETDADSEEPDEPGPLLGVPVEHAASSRVPQGSADGIFSRPQRAYASPSLSFSPGLEPWSHNSPVPLELSSEEADARLERFRTNQLQFFPIVHLPPGIRAHHLQQDRPNLLLAIIAVTTPGKQQRLARGLEFKRILAQNTLIENRSNVDLLLALVVYVAWSGDQFLNRDGTLSRLTLMAMSIVFDLRMDKPVPSDEHMAGGYIKGWVNVRQEPFQATKQLELERQRAVLGCYLLSTIVSSYFAQIDAMRWTPRLEETLAAISANTDCPSDAILAFQVRLQNLAQKAVQVRDRRDSETPTVAAAMPVSLYIKLLHGQLQELKASAPALLLQHNFLAAHTHFLEVCFNEVENTANSEAPLATPSSVTGGVTDFERLECLWRSVNSIKAFWDIMLAEPPATNSSLPFIYSAQSGRCFTVLLRLSISKDPAWDRQAVRNKIDVLLLADQLADRMEQSSIEVGEQSDEDFFRQWTKIFRSIRTWHGPKTAPDTDMEVSTSVDMVYSDPWAYIDSTDFGSEGWLSQIIAGLE